MEKKTKTIIGIFAIIAVTLIAIGIVCPYASGAKEMVRLRITTPPNPNMIPAFILLEQGKLEDQGIKLEYIPSMGASDLMAHLQSGDVDIALFSVPGGSKMYHKGIRKIRLIGVHVWKAIYVVAGKDISSWANLKGKDIYIAFRGGPPDVITRASMKAAGYKPYEDFNIKYLPGSEIKQLILSGKANAAVFPEPHVSLLLLKSKGKLKVAISPQKGFARNISNWKEGEEIPVGGLWAIAPNIKEEKREAVKKFIEAFSDANEYAMEHPEEAGKVTSKNFKQYFGGKFPSKAVTNSISSGRLQLDFRGVEKLKPLIPSYLKALGFPIPDEGIYYKLN